MADAFKDRSNDDPRAFVPRGRDGRIDRCRIGARPNAGVAARDARGGAARHTAATAGPHAGREDARLRHRHQRHRARRRRAAAARRGRQLHLRTGASSGARDDRPADGAPRRGPHLPDQLEREQDVPGHRACGRHEARAQSVEPGQAHRPERARAIRAPGRGLCAAAVRARHGRPVHRRRRRPRPAPLHRPRQPDRAATRPGDDRDLDRQRQRRRAGQPARPRVRHDVGEATPSSSKPRSCRRSRSGSTSS